MPNLSPALLWELADLPHCSLPITGNLLPPLPSIYIVYQHEQVLYVGQTMCLNQRWVAHHRREDFDLYPTTGLAWHVLPGATPEDLHQEERRLIAALQPILNKRSGPRRGTTHARGPQTIGDCIYAWRKANQWSQHELAERTGLSPKLLNHYERNRITNIPSDSIAILAKAFGVTPGALYPKNYVPVTPEVVQELEKETSHA